MSAPQDHQAPAQDAKAATQESQRATEMSASVVSKKAETPLPAKGHPPNPKGANTFQDEQNSQANSSGVDVEMSQYDYVIVAQPTPPPPAVTSQKGKDVPTSSPVPTPRQVRQRSDSNEPVGVRSNSPRNHKEQRRGVEELVLEISHREDERVRMREHIDKLHERITSMESEIAALNTSLSDTEHALHSTRQDLSASRAFVASEGGVDAQFLIKMMRDLNSSIDDFAYELLQSIPDATLTRKVSRSGLEALVKSSDHARRIITFINLAFQKRATIGDFIQPFVQYALCIRLFEVVFSLWVPGMPRDKSEIFHSIYNLVHRREAQERSARWRAITYSHAWPERDDQKFCEHAGNEVLSRLADSLGLVCGTDQVSFDTLKAVFPTTMSDLFMDAIKFQDKARASYMSFDYIPFIPHVDEPFNPMFMETNQEVRQGSTSKSSHAVLPVTFGIQAWKSVVKEDRTIGKEAQIALKSHVLCGTWSPNAS